MRSGRLCDHGPHSSTLDDTSCKTISIRRRAFASPANDHPAVDRDDRLTELRDLLAELLEVTRANTRLFEELRAEQRAALAGYQRNLRTVSIVVGTAIVVLAGYFVSLLF